MSIQNKTKIVIGMVFIVAAFICVGAIFYFMGNIEKEKTEKIARLEAHLTNLIMERSAVIFEEEGVKKVKREPIKVASLVEKAEDIYGEEERKRREGVLWIDQKSLQGIVTLGAVNGLRQGSEVHVFDKGKAIGIVVVEIPLDIISYVNPAQDVSIFKKEYYRVVFDDSSEK